MKAHLQWQPQNFWQTWSKWMNMCAKKKMNKRILATWRQQKYKTQLLSIKKMWNKEIIWEPVRYIETTIYL